MEPIVSHATAASETVGCAMHTLARSSKPASQHAKVTEGLSVASEPN